MVHDRGLSASSDKPRCPNCGTALVPTGLVEEPWDTYECPNCGYEVEVHKGGRKDDDEADLDTPGHPFP